MWNIMLDEKPEQWNGYPVNTDFRIGIQLNQVFNDSELSNREKLEEAAELLFPCIMPPAEEMPECLKWFLSGWYLDGESSRKESTKSFDFDIDQWRIYSAFRLQFGINLNTANLHYWEFMGLLSTLEECAFTRVKDIRQRKIEPKMGSKDKKALEEAKRIYGLEGEKKAAAPDKKEDEFARVFLNRKYNT